MKYHDVYTKMKGAIMTIAIKKWGNSLAIRLPKDIAESLKVDNESKLDMKVEDGKLILVPKHREELSSLLQQITPENLHAEIDTGEAVGHEIW